MFKAKVADLGSPSYFVLTAAVALGYFEREGISISPVEGGLSGPDEMKAGTLHFLGGPAYAALKAFPNFHGAKLLCALAQYAYWFLGVRTDLDLPRGSFSALRNLRISSSAAEPGIALRHLLREFGVDPDRNEVTIVPSPSSNHHQTFRGDDGLLALQRNEADCFWGNGMRLAIAERAGVAKLHVDLRRGIGPLHARFYNFPALLASEELIRARPDVAAGAIRAIVKTQHALRADPSLATKVGQQMFPAQEAGLIAGLIESDAPFYSATITRDAVNGLNDFCALSGLMTKPVPYDEIVATRFVELWQ